MMFILLFFLIFAHFSDSIFFGKRKGQRNKSKSNEKKNGSAFVKTIYDNLEVECEASVSEIREKMYNLIEKTHPENFQYSKDSLTHYYSLWMDFEIARNEKIRFEYNKERNLCKSWRKDDKTKCASKKETIIGIDLGTTFSAVGDYDFEMKSSTIFRDNAGNEVSPSEVYLVDPNTYKFIACDEVKDQKTQILNNHPDRLYYNIKRTMGLTLKQIKSQKELEKMRGYELVNDEELGGVLFVDKESQKKFTPEQLSAEILKSLKKRAQKFRRDYEISKAIITVPAAFRTEQKLATKKAAWLAKLEVMHLLSEPVAATISYTNQPKTTKQGIFFVIDFGGGTCDLSILQKTGNVFKVLGIKGDNHLGGEDISASIIDDLKKAITRELEANGKKFDPKDKKLKNKMREEATKLKERLSNVDPDLMLTSEINTQKETIEFQLSREKLENLNKENFNKFKNLIKGILQDLNLKKSDIDQVILVGGSSRIPKIKEITEKIFPNKVYLDPNPQISIAIGASISAGSNHFTEIGFKQPNSEDGIREESIKIINVLPDSIGIKTCVDEDCDVMTFFFKKGDVVPTKKIKKIYHPHEDYQKSITVEVFRGEKKVATKNQYVGSSKMKGFKIGKSDDVRIELTLQYDRDGIIHLFGKDLRTEKDLGRFKIESHSK